MNEVHFMSETVEWATPPELYAELDAEFHFTCDVCANAGNAKHTNFYTVEMDGLRQKWTGTNYCNPPYGRVIGQWVKKAYDSALDGATTVMLIPARTDTKWFHEFCGSAEIRFLRGRLYFGGGAERGDDGRSPFP